MAGAALLAPAPSVFFIGSGSALLRSSLGALVHLSLVERVPLVCQAMSGTGGDGLDLGGEVAGLDRLVAVGVGPVAQLRERGLTQRELGRRCGLSRSFLSQVENGNRVPSLSSLTRISAALDVMPIDVLVRDEQEISEKNENRTQTPNRRRS